MKFVSGIRTITLAICLSGFSTAHATNLIDIYQAALQNDAELSAAAAKLKADKEVVAQGWAQLLPDITASGRTFTTDRVAGGGGIGSIVGDSGGAAGPVPAGDPDNERFNSKAYGVRLTQPILRLDRWFALFGAKETKKQALAEYDQAQQALVIRVAEAYFNILRAEDNLQTASAAEVAFKRQLEQTQERFDVGLIAITDVHEAQSAYDSARVDRITAEENRYNSLTVLETLTNQSYDSILPLDKSMPIEGPIPTARFEWVDIALAKNHDLRIARHSVNSAKQTARERSAGHAPTLDGVYDFNHSATGGFFGDRTETETFTLELNIPIFQGGGTQSRVREAYYRLQQAKSNYELQHRRTKQDVQTRHRTVSTDVLRVGAQKLALRSSQSALEATRGGYDVGTRNIVDVIQAERVLFQAQSNYYNAIYDYIINYLQLKQAAGTLNADDLLALNQWLKAAPGKASE